MKTMLMPDLRWGNVKLGGGWQIGVPEIGLDNETTAMLRESGLDVAMVTESMQGLFENGMMRSVRVFVRYWSRRYARMFPELHDMETGWLDGFDPEDLMRYWLPGEKSWGKPNMVIQKQLVEYARIARREREDNG